MGVEIWDMCSGYGEGDMCGGVWREGHVCTVDMLINEWIYQIFISIYC